MDSQGHVGTPGTLLVMLLILGRKHPRDTLSDAPHSGDSNRSPFLGGGITICRAMPEKLASEGYHPPTWGSIPARVQFILNGALKCSVSASGLLGLPPRASRLSEEH